MKRVTPTNSFIEFPAHEVEQSIPQRFEKIVNAYPERVAIKTKNDVWTYESLNSAANRVAERILNETPEDNEPVAILMGKGAAVIIAILAVLKAGKTYLPLDPQYPAEMRKFIFEDAEPQLIITNAQNRSLASACITERCRVVDIDEINPRGGTHNPDIAINPGAFASILYTSGSTGRPKGVVDCHRNVLHGTLRFTNGLHINADDRMSLTHSCSSSASIRRIFPALLNGASLYPLDLKESGMEALVDLLVTEQITYFSTGRIRDFVRTLGTHHRFDQLRLVSFGGEIVHRSDLDLYRKIFPPHCLIGIWMSTTETGNVTQYFIDSQTNITGEIAPIGYPVDGVEVLLVDEQKRPVSQGVAGEIVIKSRYLAAGYWRRPDLTQSKFLPISNSDERLYFTGDLGRMDSEGCFYHLGRKDDQVKVRGYRVETAETEVALVKIPAVKKAFVTARDSLSGAKQLIAYVVPQTGSAPTVTALRNALATTLPSYMIPTIFVMLDHLPLTPTGKVNRKALPAPSDARPHLDVIYVEPRTPTETHLALIWSQVLSVHPVGINDNFFDLGGHSLSAVRLVSAIVTEFETQLSLHAVFQWPTVSEMAAALDKSREQRLGEREITRIVAELELLTDEEAQRLLSGGHRSDPAGTQ